MNIQLKTIKYAKFASEETNCFTANVWVDGKNVGTVSNNGHGGPNNFFPRTIYDVIKVYTDTLPMQETNIDDPKSSTGKFRYKSDPDNFISGLVETYLIERDLGKALDKRILYTVSGKQGIFQTKPATNKAALKVWLLTAKAKLGADKVLNLLPLPEALAIYKSGNE